MSKETGGPAFPNPRWEGWGSPQEGMTLRDYFAACAPEPSEHWKGNYARERGYTSELKLLADWGYEYADAMLKAREQK